MEALAAVLPVLRALIDAAFSSGGINDAVRTVLHGKLDAVDPAVDQAAAPALTDAEKTQLEQLQAKQDAAAQPSREDAPPLPAADVPPAAPVFGSEGTGFGA